MLEEDCASPPTCSDMVETAGGRESVDTCKRCFDLDQYVGIFFVCRILTFVDFLMDPPVPSLLKSLLKLLLKKSIFFFLPPGPELLLVFGSFA